MKTPAPHKIRIAQILQSLKYGDAVGNDCIAIHRALKAAGYDTAIFAVNIDSHIQERKIQDVDFLDNYTDNADILICHITYYWDYLLKLDKLKGKKLFIYHNITPPRLLEEYGEFESAAGCRKGLNQVKQIRSIPTLCLTPSEYNKTELEKMGYSCPIHILPILTDLKETEEKLDTDLLEKYKNDGTVNILFVGRISPNKKQQDILATFYQYHEFINRKSRLFIVGAGDEYSAYYKAIKKYSSALGLDSVFFTGHVSDRQKASYYKLADIFLCLSEHEGFCVPLLEAMHHKVPVVAYDSSAVTETLGGAGLLLKSKEPALVAEAIDRVIQDKKLREALIENGTERLKDFAEDKIRANLLQEIEDIIALDIPARHR